METGASVLYLSYDGLTDPLGQSQILPYLSRLATRGYRFTVISFEKADRYEQSRSRIEEICSRYGIDWMPAKYHKKPPVLSTLWDLWNLRKMVSKTHRRRKFRIVHCRSYVTAIVGLWMKRNYGTKFIFDMRGFWADERIDGGLWRMSNPIQRMVYSYFKRKEKNFLEEADAVISLTENAKQVIRSWGFVTPVSVIPTCVDLELFDPAKISSAKRQDLRRSLGLSNDTPVLLYLGSLGTWYLVSEMLAFFSALKEKLPEAVFLIVTNDPMDFAGHPHAKDIVVRSVQRDEVPVYISLATMSVFFIKPSFSKAASSATKLAELMAMQIPIVTNGGWGDIEAIIRESGGGAIVQNFTRTDYFGVIGEFALYADTARKQQAHKYVKERYSLDYGCERYADVYSSLIF